MVGGQFRYMGQHGMGLRETGQGAVGSLVGETTHYLGSQTAGMMGQPRR